jgi:outer membrane protein assembly factor BamA
MLQKGYLRDVSSFYGDYDLRNQYHLPGDANLRAFGNQNFAGVEKIFSNSFEAFMHKRLGPISIEVASFIDYGVLSGSKFEPNDQLFDNTALMDYGVGLRLSTNVFGQPLYLRIDKPIDATIDGSSIEKMNDWVFSFQKSM